MAGANAESFGNRQLWQTIGGAGYLTLRPNEYIEQELKNHRDKLSQGILFYKKQRSPSEEHLNKRKVKSPQKEFVIRLSHLLGLDELQSHDLFCAYLFTEFRGSQKDIANILSHERHSETLLLKIQEFYYSERLYLIRALRHLVYYLNKQHTYKDVFISFAKGLLDNNHLSKKVIAQFEEVSSSPLPTKETHGPLMTRTQALSWALQNLKEQVELLELLVIYYSVVEMDVQTFLDLFARFKKHNFGWGQNFKHLVDGQMDKLFKRIGHLELLILIEGLDLLAAASLKNATNLSPQSHIILSDSNVIEKVDAVFSQLRSELIHGPLLLSWSILQYILGELNQNQDSAEGGETVRSSKAFSKSRHYGNLALQLGVLDYLLDLLQSEAFIGKSDLATTAQYIVYTVIASLLNMFHEDSLGNTEILYIIVSKLLSCDFIAEIFWDRPESEGVFNLYQSAKSRFPADFSSFIQFNISLASTGDKSAVKVKSELSLCNLYTELLENSRSQDLVPTSQKGVFTLGRNKYPFPNSDFMIASGCEGYVSAQSSSGDISTDCQLIRWEATYNGWHYLLGEIQELLRQVSHGAGDLYISGMVQTEQVLKVSMVMRLVKEIMASHTSSVPEFSEITQLGYQILLRFAVLNPAPLELLSHTIQCLSLSVPDFYTDVFHHLKQTGFLPFLTKNISSFSDIQSGDGVNQGLYGCVLTGTECAQGVYIVTLATLDLVTQLVQYSSKQGTEHEHLASVLFLLREVFPRYNKWRFVDHDQYKCIGQKCLQLFHGIFNFANILEHQKELKQHQPSVQEACVYSLLFTDAGRALLEIISIGVDNIQSAIAQQASLLKGLGVDMVELIQIALSLLNLLLLLKPPNLGASPVEQALSSQPPGRQHQHLVATIAQYIFHRHNHRLPNLSVLLLKRLAMVSPMSILACLGNEAESIRDMFLTRLQAVSEDIQLKVSILEFLSVCVDTQPGLLELFLNVQQPEDKATEKTKPDLKVGRNSCLPILLDLMEVKKQCTYECPPELLCACLDLVHSLWHGMRETPMTVLRDKDSFWPSVLAPLLKDLPVADKQAFKFQTRLRASALRLAALEVHAVPTSQLSSSFKKNLGSTFANERIVYWSNAIKDCILTAAKETKALEAHHDQTVADLPALNLLLAWKSFLTTLTCYKVTDIKLSDKIKYTILLDLLHGINAQFESGDPTPVKMKLASIASGLYFTLIKSWGNFSYNRDISQCEGSQANKSASEDVVSSLTSAISGIRESTGVDMILPSVHIGLLGAVTSILQQCGPKIIPQQCGPKIDNLPTLISDLLPVVCTVFLQSLWLLPSLVESNAASSANNSSEITTRSKQPESFNAHIKLQIVCCCLIVELLQQSSNLSSSLAVIQEHGIVSSLLTTAEALMKAKQGISFIYTAFLLLIEIANTEMGANMLLNSNVTSHLCLVLTTCYSSEDAFQPRNILSKAFTSSRSLTVTWHSLYCLSLDLFSVMLYVLGFSFLEDALNIVGVHQARMQQSLLSVSMNMSKSVLQEAQATLNFIKQLCVYQKQWRFHLPNVMAKLMGALMDLVHSYVALMIRPRYLQLLLDHHKVQDSAGKAESLLQAPTYLQHQSSLDDVEQPTGKLVDAQNSMLKLVGQCLFCLKYFTPSLPEVLCDQGIDVSDWEPILSLGFGTPSLDGDRNGLTFGTLINCVNVCVRHLVKNDTKLSPHRSSPEDANSSQVSKNVVHLVLELSLDLLMSQACRYLRDPELAARDCQFLKRELGTELNSCLSPLHRQLRRGADRSLSLTPPQHQSGVPTTTSAGVLTASTQSTASPSTPQLSRSVSQTLTGPQDPSYIRLVQAFVQKVLK
ncbi:nucleoporin NUP188-like isoform X1 [Biomphalaria glabrata]|uniref:Nucleoporin NUP188-like isoform X1 n=1 Tax=Biomphalaria glabrata TaxID=6526 RepID=A0A9W3BCY2_BIOGL|nr:nucleoporin NUP188-like isoform X1 [Biomphalaria glabrata]